MIDLFLLFLMGIILWFLFPYMKKNVDNFLLNRKMKDVRECMLGYKRRRTGNNRFVVTKETLQDVFREYDGTTIDKVWNQLVNERIIEQDPMDNEWCIR